MAWNTDLNGKALEIASSNAKRLKVVAGPGTGKSFTMQRRVARLLEEGTAPKNILAVTFTRTAAAALLKDLHNLGVKGCDKIRVGTLHSLCFSILHRGDVFSFLQRTPTPLITFNKFGILQFQAEPLLQDLNAPAKYGTKRDKSKRIRAFEAAWARLQSDLPGWPTSAIDKSFEKALIEWLTFHDAMLIGEVIPLTLKYLRKNPSATELIQYKHVIVDEYQDLNKAEQELINLLGAKGTISIVGDPDQSIYRFRHANPEGIDQFKISHPATVEKDLDECRRCPTKVVELANELIMHNHSSTSADRLQPLSSNPDGEVYMLQWDDLAQQTKGTAKYVNYLIEKKSYSAGDILVLCPRRQIGYDIKDALNSIGITAHSFFSEESLEEDESQLAFILLFLLANNEDKVALRYWLGYGDKYWLEKEYRILRSHCEKSNQSPWEALNTIENGFLDLKGINKIEKRFKILLKSLDKLADLAGEDLVDALFPSKKSCAILMREAALSELEKETTAIELKEKLIIAITQPEVPETPDFVRVMSLYKAKGLTAKVTIITGVIQGLIPLILGDASADEKKESLKEQRRVFYVALTRPTEILVVSSIRMLQRELAHKMRAMVYKGVGAYGTVISSQFLDEMGPNAPDVVRGLDWQKKGFE